MLHQSIKKIVSSNNLIIKNQSGFRPNDSIRNQLICLVDSIHSSLDINLDVRSIFLDMSKAFDKVWHEGLLFKLKQNGINGKLLNLLKNYLANRNQRVLLNGFESGWGIVESGVPQGSVLGPLLFLIYINDLENSIKSHVKKIAGDTSLFTIVKDPDISALKLNHDLHLISQWAYQWKMSFNPDPTKQAVQVIFMRKSKQIDHPKIYFNDIEVNTVNDHDHLGLILDSKLSFISHINEKISKAHKGLDIIRSLFRFLLSVKTLDLIFKLYIRPHLGFCDVIFHIPSITNPFDSSINLNYLMNTLERVQYHAALAITGSWKRTNLNRIYDELGWESLTDRRWCRRLSHFYKIQNNLTPPYLKDPIPPIRSHLFGSRSVNVINEIRCKSKGYTYSNSLYPDSIRCWNKIGPELRTSPNLKSFKLGILAFVRPPPKRIFDPIGMKWLFQLRVGLSLLYAHKLNHNFSDTPCDKCDVCKRTENLEHLFLHCIRFTATRRTLLNSVLTLNVNFNQLNPQNKIQLLLYGDTSFSEAINKWLLISTLKFLRDWTFPITYNY